MRKFPEEYRAKGFIRIWNAARYSLQGLQAAYQGEAAFRQEIWLTCPLMALIPFLGVSIETKLVMIVCHFAVLITELLNSALESVVDKVSPEYHPLAKQAKDMGSAAVMLSLLCLAVVWTTAVISLF